MESPSKKLELITKYFADFTPKQLAQIEGLEPAYKEWNSQINVISRKDIDHIYLHHILHSLSIAAIVEWEKGTQVIDIGCGGGFPCVPLAIFFPEVQFPLTDLWRWAGPILNKKPNQNNSLICLKGGDLHQEIFESGVRPKMMSIHDIFPEAYFEEKFIIQVKKP